MELRFRVLVVMATFGTEVAFRTDQEYDTARPPIAIPLPVEATWLVMPPEWSFIAFR
jgi:hypothetical protein